MRTRRRRLHRLGRGFGAWRFDPADKSWTRLLDESLAMELNADPSDPTRLMLVTSQDPFNDFASGNGVWISADDGASWTPANQNLPMHRCNACAFDPFDPELVVVGQYGGGFMKARWPKSYRPSGTRRYSTTDQDRSDANVRDFPAPSGGPLGAE